MYSTRGLHESCNRLIVTSVNWRFRSSLADVLGLEVAGSTPAPEKRKHILEIPISYRERPTGSGSRPSTYRERAAILATLFDTFRKYRLLALFGWSAIPIFVPALLAGAPPTLNSVSSGYVYYVPLVVLAASLMLTAMLAFSVGVTSAGVEAAARQNAELHLLLALIETRHSRFQVARECIFDSPQRSVSE